MNLFVTAHLSVWYALVGILMAYNFRLNFLLLAFLLCGCGAKKKDKSGLWRKIIRNGDQLYLQRADRGELDKAIQWYLSGVREFPNQSRMMGRLSRAYAARAYGHADDGLDGYATARRFGLDCLMTDPSFGGLVQAQGGTISRRAVETLDASMVECMTWASLAWSRWMEQRGVMGTSIDLPSVRALAVRAVEADPKYDNGRPYSALGLALALPPKPLKPKLKKATEAFQLAMEMAPTRLTPKVDYAQYVVAVQGEQAQWAQLLNEVINSPQTEDDPDQMENQRAIQRARALLSAGLDKRWEED